MWRSDEGCHTKLDITSIQGDDSVVCGNAAELDLGVLLGKREEISTIQK